jgi:hypothetical protein
VAVDVAVVAVGGGGGGVVGLRPLAGLSGFVLTRQVSRLQLFTRGREGRTQASKFLVQFFDFRK